MDLFKKTNCWKKTSSGVWRTRFGHPMKSDLVVQCSYYAWQFSSLEPRTSRSWPRETIVATFPQYRYCPEDRNCPALLKRQRDALKKKMITRQTQNRPLCGPTTRKPRRVKIKKLPRWKRECSNFQWRPQSAEKHLIAKLTKIIRKEAQHKPSKMSP